MQILGYLTLYMKFISKDSIYYAKSEQDFRKPITRDVLQTMLEGVKLIYEKAYQQTIIDAMFISKEEYESQNNAKLETHVMYDNNEQTITNLDVLSHPETWTYEIIGKAFPDGPERILFATKSEDQFKEMVGQNMTVPSEMESYQDVHLYYLRFKYENGVRINESYDMFANTWLPLRKES